MGSLSFALLYYLLTIHGYVFFRPTQTRRCASLGVGGGIISDACAYACFLSKLFDLDHTYIIGTERYSENAFPVSEQGGAGGVCDPTRREHAQIPARARAGWRRAPLRDVWLQLN